MYVYLNPGVATEDGSRISDAIDNCILAIYGELYRSFGFKGSTGKYTYRLDDTSSANTVDQFVIHGLVLWYPEISLLKNSNTTLSSSVTILSNPSGSSGIPSLFWSISDTSTFDASRNPSS